MPDSPQPDTDPIQQRAQDYLLKQRAQHYLGFQGGTAPDTSQFGYSNLTRQSGAIETPAELSKHGATTAMQAFVMALGAGAGGAITGGAGPLTEAAAEILGGYTGGRITGVPPKEAAIGAVLGGAGGLAAKGLNYGATRLTGRMAGLTPEAVKGALRDPTILRTPEPNAELNMARSLDTQLGQQAATETPYHADYKAMLSKRAGDRIDAAPALEAFTKQITGGDHPIQRAADRQVNAMGERFLNRVGGDGKISLGQLDRYIRENFTDPLKGAYSRGSESEAVTRLKQVRADLADYLYKQVGPGAAPAQSMTQQALSTREAVEGRFSIGTPSKPSAAGANAIVNIRSNGGAAQLNRDILAKYDEEYGTNWLSKATRLSMQREWTGRAAQDAMEIDSILRPERPSFIRGVARHVARGGVRAQPFASPVGAATTAAFAQAMNPMNNP